MAKPSIPIRTRRHALLLFAVLAVVIAFGVMGFREAGRWLVREDPAGHADAILVLSGGMPYRAEAAAQLYREGYAPVVWVTRPSAPVEELRSLGVEFVGEEEYDRRILEHAGVPEAAIMILPGEIVNTQQEIESASREMVREGKSTILIVTSPQHTRRVRTLWGMLAEKQDRAIVRAAQQDPFDAGHWWRNTRDALAVVREYLGLVNAWAGLPVRAHAK